MSENEWQEFFLREQRLFFLSVYPWLLMSRLRFCMMLSPKFQCMVYMPLLVLFLLRAGAGSQVPIAINNRFYKVEWKRPVCFLGVVYFSSIPIVFFFWMCSARIARDMDDAVKVTVAIARKCGRYWLRQQGTG